METTVSSIQRITVISNSNFREVVLENEKPVLLMCASKDQETIEQTRILEQVLTTYDESIAACLLEEDFINGFKQMYNIKGTPVFLLFEKGELKGRMLGIADKERLETFLSQMLSTDAV